MAIDKSGTWWKGGSADDLGEYLVTAGIEGYEIREVRSVSCTCGSRVFRLLADRTEGCAERECNACHAKKLICDSADYWDEANPEAFQCLECGAETTNITVGFSLRENGEVRWVAVGVRCATCGLLGIFADWKVDYAPSRHLLDEA